MSWSDVEASGRLVRTGSYLSSEEDGPVLDLRHDRVKASSPVVIYQDRPYSVSPLSAEIVTVQDVVSASSSHAAPSSTLVCGINHDAAAKGSVEDTVRISFGVQDCD